MVEVLLLFGKSRGSCDYAAGRKMLQKNKLMQSIDLRIYPSVSLHHLSTHLATVPISLSVCLSGCLSVYSARKCCHCHEICRLKRRTCEGRRSAIATKSAAPLVHWHLQGEVLRPRKRSPETGHQGDADQTWSSQLPQFFARATRTAFWRRKWLF